MRIREKNHILKGLITSLEQTSREKKAPIWKAVAKGLNRPRRVRFEVNLVDLERVNTKETIVVPGKVLGSGSITKPLRIAALHFSGQSKESIKKAGGETFSVQELLEKNPEGKNIRLIA